MVNVTIYSIHGSYGYWGHHVIYWSRGFSPHVLSYFTDHAAATIAIYPVFALIKGM